LKSGSLPWSPPLAAPAADLSEALESADTAAFEAALDREARHRLDEFLTGIARYRGHAYRRTLTDPEPIWRDGTTRLRDFGAPGMGPQGGRPLLVIPSLVNRAYVLDLAPRRSLMRFLRRRGFRPLLVDWDTPGAQERDFDLDDYIRTRLSGALGAATALAGAPVPVLGYCMGGLLALALAARQPEQVAALALLATPWDFHAATGGPPPWLAALAEPLRMMIEALGVLPVDALQALFFSLDPTQGWSKFRRFATLDERAAATRYFVALEDWANDGVPLAGKVASECLFGWYLDNTTGRGDWHIGGAPVRPQDLRLPTLVAVPAQDRIVPPPTAAALIEAIPGATALRPAAGHIGMVVGAGARRRLWTPLAEWLEAQEN